MGVSSLIHNRDCSKMGSGQEKEDGTNFVELPYEPYDYYLRRSISSLNRFQLCLLTKSCTCTVCPCHLDTPPC
eukprot:scaffold13391_cov71-Skeletonema_dohrnii-CCMP3373.AAC.1